MYPNITDEVKQLVELALKEDVGRGDITTQAIFHDDTPADGFIKCKQNGVVAGLELAGYIFHRLDKKLNFVTRCSDGQRVNSGDILAVINGPVGSLLTGERTALNFLQRMSGVATMTRRLADAIAHTRCRILDTRKTAPGHRYTDKWAVRLGGGKNHRARLDDMFLIKDNHIAAAGGIREAIDACNRYRESHGLQVKIEIEVGNWEELEIVLHHGKVDIILLDNMPVSLLEKAVRLTDGRFQTEASGNITVESAAEIAETGVDFISSGALTHSVTALDISLFM